MFRSNYYGKILNERQQQRVQPLSLSDILAADRIDYNQLRTACFRGVPKDQRYDVWKTLLFHTPQRTAEFNDLLATVYARDVTLMLAHRKRLEPLLQQQSSPGAGSAAGTERSLSTSTEVQPAAAAAAAVAAGAFDGHSSLATAMDASQTVPAAESSAPLLHQILPTLVPYTPDRFNDMYSVWAGEILLPVGSFVSEPEDDERAILRNKFAAVVGSVTQEPVEAFWLTVNFWLLVQRHLSEAERLHQPSLARKVMQTLGMDPILLGYIVRSSEMKVCCIAALNRWLQCFFAELLPTELVLTIWDLYLASDSLEVFVLAGCSVLQVLRVEIQRCTSASELHETLSPARLQRFSAQQCKEVYERVHAQLIQRRSAPRKNYTRSPQKPA